MNKNSEAKFFCFIYFSYRLFLFISAEFCWCDILNLLGILSRSLAQLISSPLRSRLPLEFCKLFRNVWIYFYFCTWFCRFGDWLSSKGPGALSNWRWWLRLAMTDCSGEISASDNVADSWEEVGEVSVFFFKSYFNLLMWISTEFYSDCIMSLFHIVVILMIFTLQLAVTFLEGRKWKKFFIFQKILK